MAKKKKKAKKKAKKKGLAGVLVSFKSVEDMTLGEVYGKKPIPITHLAKNIWKVIKKKDLRV